MSAAEASDVHYGLTTLQVALSLAEEHGLPVFPCRSHDEVIKGRSYKAKSPLTPNGFKDATTNLDQIEQWWQRYPDALIGVPTGATSGLFVIDVDPRGAEWYAKNADRLNAGRVHKTPRGHHLLCRDIGLGCTTGTLADGVDTRGEGGYIIWWLAAGQAAVGDLEDIQPPPTWVVDALQSADAHKSERIPSAGGIEGDRSKDLLQRVGRDVRAGLADYEIIAKHQAHPHVLAQTNPDRAVQRCIDKARTDTSSKLDGAAGVERLAEEFAELRKQRPIVIKSASQLAASVHVATWLLKPYLEKNSSVLIFGDLGTFKSFLALLWALQAALLGHQVIYLSAEGKGLGRRVKGWAIHTFGDGWETRLQTLPFFAIEQPLNLSAAAVVENLLYHIEAGAIVPALIVVDTISKNSDGRVEASTEDATEYLNLIDRELRARFECCVALVHHTGHAEKNRARGPYALMANTDANFRIERPDTDAMVVTVTAGRMKDCEPPAPFSLAGRVVETGDTDEDGNPVTTLVLEPSETVEAKPKRPTGRAQKSILSALERIHKSADGPHVWTIDEVRQIAKGLEIAKSSARDATRALVESGFLKQTIGGLALGYQP